MSTWRVVAYATPDGLIVVLFAPSGPAVLWASDDAGGAFLEVAADRLNDADPPRRDEP